MKDGAGQPIRLGALLGRGGEGSVYAVAGRAEVAAKVYRNPDRERNGKLQTMVRLFHPSLESMTAWPRDLILEHDRPVGYLMPRLTGHSDVYKLYNPKSRRWLFPQADLGFLLHCARSLAQGFAAVHRQGHVVGDVNPANLMVSDAAQVVLLDCDSFQIQDGKRIYPCNVGVATHTAPELLELPSLSGITRQPDHDNFGLAVLIFQLLFLGRHPFAGSDGDVSIEQAVRERKFTFQRGSPPPGAPPLDYLSSDLAALFEQAFTAATTRPRPEAWLQALEQVNLTRCAAEPAHAFPAPLQACPWCRLESELGVLLFGGPTTTGFNLEQFWADASSTPAPGPAPPLPATPAPKASLPRRPRWRQYTAVAGLIGLIGGFWEGVAPPQASREAVVGTGIVALALLLWLGAPSDQPLRKQLRRELRRARGRWVALSRRWRDEAEGIHYEREKARLAALRDEYLGIDRLRARRRRELPRSEGGIDLEALRQLEAELEALRQRLERDLVRSAATLLALRNQIEVSRESLYPQVLSARTAYLQARADWNAIR